MTSLPSLLLLCRSFLFIAKDAWQHEDNEAAIKYVRNFFTHLPDLMRKTSPDDQHQKAIRTFCERAKMVEMSYYNSLLSPYQLRQEIDALFDELNALIKES